MKQFIFTVICSISLFTIKAQGDNCSNPYTISGLSGSAASNTVGLINDYSASCVGASGPDMVFSLSTLVPAGHILSYYTTNDNYDVVLHGKYGSCAGSSTGCTDVDGLVIQWKNNTGAAQPVWFFVDGYYGTAGAATLNWEIVAPAAGDACNNAISISGLSGSVNSNTGGNNVWADYSAPCVGSSGPDMVFSLSTPVPAGHILRYWTTNDNYDVVLHGKYGTCTGFSTGCTDNDGSVIRWKNGTGTSQPVWFILDGFSGSSGTATLNWEIIASAAGDACNNAISISGLSGSVNSNTGGNNVWADYSAPCVGSSGPDMVFSLSTLIPNGDTLRYWTTNDNYDVVLHGKYGTCTGFSTGCTDNDGSVIQWVNTTGSAQNVWFFVDGFSGSTGTATLNWSINNVPIIPTPSIQISANSTAACTGENITFTATVQNEGSNPTYQWHVNGNPVGTNTSTYSSSTLNNNDIVTCSVTPQGGSATNSNTIAVTVYALPSQPTITDNGSGNLTSSENTGNQWYLNGNIISGAVNPSHQANQNGAYHVVVTDTNGCTSASLIYNWISVAIENHTLLSTTPMIYPNPSKGMFFIDSKDQSIDHISVYNMMGELVYDKNKYKLFLDLSNLPEGFYCVEIKTGDQRFFQSLILE